MTVNSIIPQAGFLNGIKGRKRTDHQSPFPTSCLSSLTADAASKLDSLVTILLFLVGCTPKYDPQLVFSSPSYFVRYFIMAK